MFYKKNEKGRKERKKIAEILYYKKINPPGEYLKSGKIVDINAKRWCESSVRKILTDKKINTRGD